MKKWNSPEIEMLAIENTENGMFDCDVESELNTFSKRIAVKTSASPVAPASIEVPGTSPVPGPAAPAADPVPGGNGGSDITDQLS